MDQQKIKAGIEKHFPFMTEFRERMHREPEIGFDLPKTSAAVKAELEKLGLEVHDGFGQTGLIGILRGAKPGKTVMLRADMDALPVQEEADVPYKSEVPGRMHACAHDGHMGALLGAAAVLTEMKDELPGNVVFLFQPAEESLFGGSKPMIDDGVLNVIPIDAAFSGHLWGSVKKGEIHVKSGTTMSSRDEFHFRIKGKGGHGSMPHLTIDPVVMTAQIINAFQALVARCKNPFEPVVISVCQLSTPPGAPNIIPGQVDFSGTLRTYSEDVRKYMLEKMQAIAAGICESAGGSYEFELIGGYPELVNDPEMAELALASAAKVAGNKAIRSERPNPASEDFSYFSKLIPSCYVFTGIMEDEEMPHHNPKFRWNSDAMKPLAEFLVTATTDYLNKNS